MISRTINNGRGAERNWQGYKHYEEEEWHILRRLFAVERGERSAGKTMIGLNAAI